MKQLILKYGFILFVILSVFKYLEFKFFAGVLPLELYIAIISTIFLLVGFFFAKYWIFKKLAESETLEDLNQNTLNYRRLSEFSPREQDVLQLLCRGYENKEIAKSLNISPNTVKTHISRVFVKLNVHNRTEALAEAKSLNIVN